MSNYLSILSILIILSIGSCASAADIGFRETRVVDERGERTLSVAVWYPSRAPSGPEQLPAAVESVAENRAFFGVAAVGSRRNWRAT